MLATGSGSEFQLGYGTNISRDYLNVSQPLKFAQNLAAYFSTGYYNSFFVDNSKSFPSGYSVGLGKVSFVFFLTHLFISLLNWQMENY